MTWEETIKFIRTQPEFQFLVAKAYFEENLPVNVERYRQETEYKETVNKIKKYAPNAKKILEKTQKQKKWITFVSTFLVLNYSFLFLLSFTTIIYFFIGLFINCINVNTMLF